MAIDAEQVTACLEECKQHLTTELLPFWLDRCKDDENGGFITHFDKDGNDTGGDEKSLIAQTRTVYTMSSAHRAGYGDGKCGGQGSYRKIPFPRVISVRGKRVRSHRGPDYPIR